MSGWDRIARTSAETRGVVAALSVLVLFLVLAALVGSEPAPASDVPDGVPSGLVQPLQELHDAVEGDAAPGEQVPGLARKLERVDAAVVDGRYDRARAAIGALAAQAARVRVAGELSAEETERILDAAQALVGQLAEDDEGCCSPEDDAGRADAQSGS
jgi:hypothetical protein